MSETTFVISSQWLAQHLNDPQVVVVDCRFSLEDPELGQKQYHQSHIPGAYYLHLNRDLSSPVGLHGGRHPLPNVTELAAKLASIGVNFAETLVIAYDDSRFAFAARLWWLLRYLGHDKVALLNGGFAGWQTADYPVTDAVPAPPQPGIFVPDLLRSHLVADIAAVKARKDLPEVILVDSREPERYRGEREPIDPIAGHIPGAVNYPWKDVTDEQARLHSLTKQQQRWENLKDAKEILVYCGSGVTACVNLLSLEIAGIHTGTLYAGSWSDWCSYQL